MKRDDISVELVISEILRWGVRISLGLMVLGTLICFGHWGEYGAHGGTNEDLQVLVSQGAGFPRNLSELGGGLLHLRGTAIVVAGLALLILTPMMRVVASAVAFALQKDRAFTAISALVLLLLVLSFVLGKV